MLRQLSKKGISEMVTYVLIVIIGVALSVGVYSFVKFQIPQEAAECNSDTSLIVKSYFCDTNKSVLTLELQNKGLFNIDGAFIRFSEVGRTTRQQLNEDNETFPVQGLSGGQLKPEETIMYRFNISNFLKPDVYEYTVEIQPAMFNDHRLLPCENLVNAKTIQCGELPEG